MIKVPIIATVPYDCLPSLCLPNTQPIQTLPLTDDSSYKKAKVDRESETKLDATFSRNSRQHGEKPTVYTKQNHDDITAPEDGRHTNKGRPQL